MFRYHNSKMLFEGSTMIDTSTDSLYGHLEKTNSESLAYQVPIKTSIMYTGDTVPELRRNFETMCDEVFKEKGGQGGE